MDSATTGTAAAGSPSGRVTSWVADRSVMTRVASAVLAALAVGALVSGLALTTMAHMKDHAQEIRSRGLAPIAVLSELRRSVVQSRLDALGQETARTQAGFEGNTKLVKADDAHVDELVAELREMPLAADQVQALSEFDETWKKYRVQRDGDLLLARAGKWAEFEANRIQLKKPLADTALAALSRLYESATATAEAGVQETVDQYDSDRRRMLVVMLLGMVLALGLSVLVARSITRPVHRLLAMATALGRGDLAVRSGITSADEIGRLAHELDASTAAVRDTVGGVAASATQLAGYAEQLTATSSSIETGIEDTARRAGAISSEAEAVTRNIQTVASGAEQLGASIREITRNAADAAQVAATAVEEAAATTTTVGRLGESSTEIGNVVKLINSIAEQTNLLALNATIEAARAGETGKGFAVVANEVKELAQETAKATEDISRRVQAIQADTDAAVAAISRIETVIGEINTYQTTIAGAVEEQTATTSEMARSVGVAAGAAAQIATGIGGVATATETSTAGMHETALAVDRIRGMSAELRRLIERFHC